MLRGLAQYRLLRLLARGGQADVYLAMDTRLSRRVCIKIYHLQHDRSLRRRLEAEAWKLARVSSPRVVQIYDVVAHGAELALVYGYVAGCDLQQLLDQEEGLPACDAVAIVSDLAEALAAVRAAGLVHGDLSPRNVLLDGAGRATLGDFGVAVMRGEYLLGFSADALAPEQLADGRGDLRSDFFALGLLLYRALTGTHPFYRGGTLDRGSLSSGLRQAPAFPDLPREAADALSKLLLRLLARDPAQRPSGTFELREQLREVRALLPSATTLGTRVLRSARNSTSQDLPLKLPPRLVRLPWYRHVVTALGDGWRRSALPLRAFFLGGVLLPVALGVSQALGPTACIAVNTPTLHYDGISASQLPNGFAFRERLTSILKERAPRALILGAGIHSDSRPSLGVDGLSDRCVAERQVFLKVHCIAGDCALDLRSDTPQGSHTAQMNLPLYAGKGRYDAALTQLLREQLYLLLP